MVNADPIAFVAARRFASLVEELAARPDRLGHRAECGYNAVRQVAAGSNADSRTDRIVNAELRRLRAFQSLGSPALIAAATT